MRRLAAILSASMLLVSLFAVPVLATGDQNQTISAKALTDHECDSSEWHFVITQIKDESEAPDYIKVTFSGGDTVEVPLDKFTGKTAHYTLVSHLDETVVKATTKIYGSWSGQFNLSHGPCNEESPPTTTPPETTSTTAPPETTSTTVPETTSTTTPPTTETTVPETTSTTTPPTTETTVPETTSTTTPPVTTTPSTTPDTLPRTGVESDALAIVAFLALAAGSGLVALTRSSKEVLEG